jgi:hypothetical protein
MSQNTDEKVRQVTAQYARAAQEAEERARKAHTAMTGDDATGRRAQRAFQLPAASPALPDRYCRRIESPSVVPPRMRLPGCRAGVRSACIGRLGWLEELTVHPEVAFMRDRVAYGGIHDRRFAIGVLHHMGLQERDALLEMRPKLRRRPARRCN